MIQPSLARQRWARYRHPPHRAAHEGNRIQTCQQIHTSASSSTSQTGCSHLRANTTLKRNRSHDEKRLQASRARQKASPSFEFGVSRSCSDSGERSGRPTERGPQRLHLMQAKPRMASLRDERPAVEG